MEALKKAMTTISLTGCRLRRGDSEGEDRGQRTVTTGKTGRQGGPNGDQLSVSRGFSTTHARVGRFAGLWCHPASGPTLSKTYSSATSRCQGARGEAAAESSPRPAPCRASQPRPRLQGCPWRWPVVVAAAAEVGGGRGRLGGGSTGY